MKKLLYKLKNNKNLSAAEKEIARYILDNPLKVVRMSVREVAKSTLTSPNTVMRLCKKICNFGFSEFRIQLAEELAQKTLPKNIDNSPKDLKDKMKSIGEVMSELKMSVIKSIEDTEKLIDIETVEGVIDVINNSEIIDVYGRGSSNSVGSDFSYKLYRLGYKVYIHEGLDLQAIQAKNSNSNHCAIIISSTGETPEMLNFAEILNKKKTPIITITGTNDCTLLKYSDYKLYFESLENNRQVGGITSRSATQYVLDIIYFGILNRDFDKHSNTVISNFVSKDIAFRKK